MCIFLESQNFVIEFASCTLLENLDMSNHEIQRQHANLIEDIEIMF